MQSDKELMQQALDALCDIIPANANRKEIDWIQHAAITALRERLAQPEFIKHEEGGDGWSDWVCPDPDDYLIKCCDCGLVHEAQFRVVKYAPAPSEECEIVNDPNLQAVFRMRRSQRWTPDDTAYRPGGLAQPQQWEQFYPDIGNPFKRPATREEKIVNPGVYTVQEQAVMRERSCAECGKSGGWALYCVACMDKMARDDDDTQVYRSELEAAVKAEREPLLEALTAICVKCRSNEWGPTTPRKEILNWMHDYASAAIIRARGETK